MVVVVTLVKRERLKRGKIKKEGGKEEAGEYLWKSRERKEGGAAEGRVSVFTPSYD